MTKVSELTNLFQALSARDWKVAHDLAEAIASSVDRAGQHAAASRLRGALASTGPQNDSDLAITIPSLVGVPDILSSLPSARLADVELTATGRETIGEILKEHKHRSKLQAHSIRPRSRLFFHGPPGCGKTLTARAIGTSLGVPVFVVRFDSLVGSYLGQTSSRLREVFRFAESRPSVIVIDEIDAVGRQRGRAADVGEMDRIVITLMQQLELTQPATMLIAASNLASQLDIALLRRFDATLEFPLPSPDELAAFAKGQYSRRGIRPTKTLLARAHKASTFAEVERIIESEHRRILLREV